MVRQTAIPAIAAQLPLIQAVQSSIFWEGANVATLEQVRKGLRELVKFIERRKRQIVTSDFEDEIGVGESVVLPGIGVGVGVNAEKFREKALVFLKKHENEPAVHKIRWNEPLTPEDVQSLEAIFQAEGSSPEEIQSAKQEASSLGLFVRSLVGLDRTAAKAAFSDFMQGRNLTANQIEFINLVINHLVQRGWMDVAQLYESPFMDLHPLSIDGIFDEPSTGALIATLQHVRNNASGSGIS